MRAQWPRPDFLPAVQRPPWLAWVWLVTALLVLGSVVLEGWALQSQLQFQLQAQSRAQSRTQSWTQSRTNSQSTERTERVARSENTASASASATAAATPANTRNSTAALSASQNSAAAGKAAALTQHMAYPWGRVLYTLESETPPGLQWLRFDHNTANSELRFEGVAPTSDLALDTVNRLSARRGWSGVLLSRLQAPDALTAAVQDGGPPKTPSAKPALLAAEPASPVWRFEIRAAFDPRAAITSSDPIVDSR